MNVFNETYVGKHLDWRNYITRIGRFDIIEIEGGSKKDNNGKYKEISRVRVKMHDIVRDDLLEYLQKR